MPAAAVADGLPADTFSIARDVSLNEVVVTATKAAKGTPVAYSNIPQEELRKRNDGQGIPYLFSQTPSVIMTSDDGTGVGYSYFRIRGTDAARINVTVNGVPLNDAESQSVFWVNMPDFASSVGNIQIQRGAGTSTNGAAAFGATVAMETQHPEMQPYGEYSLSAGSFGTVRHTVKGGTGLLHNHFVFDARYSDVRSDGFIDRASTRMNSYFASAAWYGTSTLIKFQAFGSNEKTYQAWNGVDFELVEAGNRTYNSCGEYTDENGQVKFYDDQTDNYQQHHYHLMASQRLGDYMNLNVTLHYTPGEGYYEEYKPGQDFGSYKIGTAAQADSTTDLVRRKWLESDFYGGIFGLNYQRGKIQATLGGAVNNFVCDHFGRVMWAKTSAALPDPDYEYYRNRGKKLDYSVYAKANYAFLPHWNAYVDMQYRGIDYSIKGSDDVAGDNIDIQKNWDFFNPKAGISYSDKHHSAFASFSVAHREPGRNNFTEAAPGERPTYETLRDYEAGYTFTHPAVSAGVNLYYMDYDNQLILTGRISQIGEALTTNIKDSYRMGIELTAGARITNWLKWQGNATFSRNKIKDFTETIQYYDENWNIIPGKADVNPMGTTDIAFSPKVMGNSMFDFDWKGFSAGLYSQFVGRQYMDNTSSEDRSIDRYFVTNLRVGYAFKPSFMKELSLDVTINNLFNEEYETNGWVSRSIIVAGAPVTSGAYATQAGTNAMARVTMKF